MDPENAPHRLGRIFDGDAALYDEVRPGYPARLFDDLATEAGLRPGSRVLEIGCGTGQATVDMARRGWDVTAVEVGAALADRTRRNLADHPNATVVVAPFEDWPLPATTFDVVIAATAFHWIDPAVRVTKSAHALRPGGTLAVVATHHVAGADTRFFDAAQRCYERFDPTAEPGLTLDPPAAVPDDDSEVASSGLFAPATFHRYLDDIDYTSEEYMRLLCSYSGHRALTARDRANLLGCLRALADQRFGGRVTKTYLRHLLLARRHEG